MLLKIKKKRLKEQQKPLSQLEILVQSAQAYRTSKND